MKKRTTTALSLLEMLIALTILAIGFTALIKLQSVLTAYQQRDEQQIYARSLAENKLMALYGNFSVDKNPHGSETIQHKQLNYQLHWSSENKTKLYYSVITANVTWKTPQQDIQHLQLQIMLPDSSADLSAALLQPQQIKY